MSLTLASVCLNLSVILSKYISYHYGKQYNTLTKSITIISKPEKIGVVKHEILKSGDCVVVNQFINRQENYFYFWRKREAKIDTKKIQFYGFSHWKNICLILNPFGHQ